MRRTTRQGLAAIVAAGVALGGGATADANAPKSYKNCTAMNKVHRHGVGKPGARDHTSDEPSPTFA